MDNASCGVGMRNQKRLNDNLSPMLSLNIPTNQIASSYQTSKAIIYTFNAASSATVVDDPASINLAAMIPTASQTSVTSSQTTTCNHHRARHLKMTTTSTTQSPSSSPSVSISNQMSTTTTTSAATAVISSDTTVLGMPSTEVGVGSLGFFGYIYVGVFVIAGFFILMVHQCGIQKRKVKVKELDLSRLKN
ncbi:hypothetical protein BCR33DRAFT_711133 [Rhizoclosmatium globosum]|uniref:Uncharacterized protein n=1 Tax=Rhizoclosmatium globosum TaxID=329046 RepID=A0A1Y2D5C5_9FUNG|nr:hypothetical protein BCR33DRAFT_711133 [Rhizoclosmatium globosum]|eukprot:ORY53775.1 hypothetical protein BCR33DRAFT_711133 [Rhizoclosmatium globosum]